MKRAYERPRIIGREEFETRAMSCGKIPGRGDEANGPFCGTVFVGRVDHHDGCYVNLASRSS